MPRIVGSSLRWLAALAAVAVVAALVVWGGAGGPPQQGAGGPGGGPPGGPPVTVAAPVLRQIVDWQEFTGQFAPVESVELRARIGGYLTEIHFSDGQMVAKGDLLFVIDPRPFEIFLAAAKAKLDQANSQLEFAKRQLGRAGELQKRDYVAQSVYDQRAEEMRAAVAGVDAARALLRDAELNLQFTRITAPVSGRIGAHQVSVGNLINGGGTAGSGGGGTATLLATIVSLDPIHFIFDMSEADYFALRRRGGDGGGGAAVPAQLRLMDEEGFPHEGKLDFIDNRIDRSSGTIRARAVVPNTRNLLAPGAFGRIRLPASEPYEALLVPDAAIVTDQARKMVMTVRDGAVVPKPIKPGPVIEGLRVVRSGLDPGDQVVIAGLMRARPGAKVTAQPGSIEAK